MNNLYYNRLAQMTVPGLLMVFLLITVLSHLTPNIIDAANNASTNLTAGGYVEEAALAKLTPLFVWVVALATIALYGSPQP